MAKKNKGLLYAGIGVVALIVILTIAKSAGWIGDDNTVKITAEKVSRHTITETVSASGKIQPEVEVKISADVSGELVEMYVKEGDVVKQGTLLCKINPEIYISNLDRTVASANSSKANLENSRSRLQQAQSQFVKAELNYNRNKKLFDDGVISASDFETVKSSFEVAKAEVDAAQQNIRASQFGITSAQASVKEASENLNKTILKAPVDGTISKLSVEKGERILGTSQMTGTEIMRIANLNEMEVSTDVSENDIIRVHLGDTAIIDVDAYLDKKFKGIVTEVANSANVTGTSTDQVTNFTVKVRILRESYSELIPANNPSYSPFRPGMSATVEIQTKRVVNVISAPIQAVTTRDTAKKESGKIMKRPGDTAEKETKKLSEPETVNECVFVIKDGKAKMQMVKTGVQDNTYIEVLGGLKEGDEVVSGPFSAVSKTLKEGDKLKVVTKEELFAKEK